MAIDFRVHFLRVMVREWNVDQRKFLVKRKLQGATLAVIQQEYAYWWPPNTWHIVNAPAPIHLIIVYRGQYSIVYWHKH